MKPIILVVDDSQVDRQMAGGLLKKQDNIEVEFAWDGDDAMQRLAEFRVDVVVTDLIMPGIDGLELVSAIRSQYPQVPVALMTAYGNEEIAAEALRCGAASYVPKSQLAERLPVTVNRLVNRAMTDRCRNFAGRCLQQGAFRFELSSDLSMVGPIVNQIHRTMSSMPIGDPCDRIRACTALEEAISNAILHGSLEISADELAMMRRSGADQEFNRGIELRSRRPEFRNRKVSIEAEVYRDFAKFVVRDQGHGFDAMSHAAIGLEEYFQNGKDRGLTLMHSLVDDIHFNDVANEVTMLKTAVR